MTMNTFGQGVSEMKTERTNGSSGEEQEKPIALVAVEGFTLLIITLVAMAANITAITIILRVRSLRQNPHNLLILNLSVADLGVALTSMTLSLVSVFDGGHLLLTYHKVCLAHAFFAMIFSYVNFPTIVCIAVDRVLIVTKKLPLSRARAYIMIACCWIIALTNVMFPTNNLYLSGFAYLPDTLHCSPVWPNRIFRIIYAIINYGVVVIILTTCYIIITYHLRKKGKQLRSHKNYSVKIQGLNTSVLSHQSPVPMETKNTGQMTKLSSSVIEHPSSDTTGSDPQAPKTSSTKEPSTSLGQHPEPSELSSWIVKSSGIQRESDPLTFSAESPRVKASETSSTEETLTSKDKSLESLELSSAVLKASGMHLVSEPTNTSQVQSSLSSPTTDHRSQKKKKEEGKEEEEEEDNHTLKAKYAYGEEQILRKGKQSPSNPTSLSETVYAAPIDQGSTGMAKKKEGGNNLLQKEFYSVTETRTSQGYDSEKEVKGDGKRKVRADRKKFRAEKRVAIMGALLVLTTMLCWMPYVLHHSKYLGLPEGHWFGVFTMWLGYCNALLDPLIYSFMNYRVKKEIKSFFRSIFAVCHRMKCCFHDKHFN